MPYQHREYPEFSWSHSRNKKFQECPRSYYYHYYGSHNGWYDNAPEDARLAYRLKKLTSMALELGAAVHEGASSAIQCARMGKPAPTVADLYFIARFRLNTAWSESNDFSAWERFPNRRKMLHEFYYNSGISHNVVERAKKQLETCFQNLLESVSYREAAAAPRCEIKKVEEFVTFDMDGTPIHAVPDLIYRKGNDEWIVVDWKSGRNKADNISQASVYALYVRESLQVTQNILVRVEYLFHGETEEHFFTEDDLNKRAEDIEDSIAFMQSYLRDAARNEPLGKADFPIRQDTSLCRYCNFYQLDRDEIAARQTGPF